MLFDVSVIPLPPQRHSPGYPYYPHPYVDQYHGSPALSVLSHARGLSPGTGEFFLLEINHVGGGLKCPYENEAKNF